MVNHHPTCDVTHNAPSITHCTITHSSHTSFHRTHNKLGPHSRITYGALLTHAWQAVVPMPVDRSSETHNCHQPPNHLPRSAQHLTQSLLQREHLREFAALENCHDTKRTRCVPVQPHVHCCTIKQALTVRKTPANGLMRKTAAYNLWLLVAMNPQPHCKPHHTIEAHTILSNG